MGVTGPGEILDVIKRHANEGITLTTVGLGMGNYNDTLMEQLADDGDGFMPTSTPMKEAERPLCRRTDQHTPLTIAKDAKIQVEFNPRSWSAIAWSAMKSRRGRRRLPQRRGRRRRDRRRA